MSKYEEHIEGLIKKAIEKEILTHSPSLTYARTRLEGSFTGIYKRNSFCLIVENIKFR